jgi:xylulokinase
MFFSPVFTEAFVNATGVPVELYASDGSVGAAIGAGIGAGVFSEKEAFDGIKPLQLIEPIQVRHYGELYEEWKKDLTLALSTE